MKRIFPYAMLLLCISFAPFASAQNNTQGHLNAYENKADQLESRLDDALAAVMALNSAVNSNASSQVIGELDADLSQAVDKLNSPIEGMVSKANKIGHSGLSEATARLALFPSLLQAGSSGSSSNARTSSDCMNTCSILEEMARITGDDIRDEFQSAQNNN